MRRLSTEPEANYSDQPVYQVLAQVFIEHFCLEQECLEVKEAREPSTSSLQSPGDLEATCWDRGGKNSRGYVVNVTETCDLENPVQLIT